jgi:hypothetical protein
MLAETYELLKYLEEQISFKHTTTILLHNNSLTLQIFFRKDDTPYYYQQALTKKDIDDVVNNERFFLDLFTASLEEFYLLANTSNFEESELINQTIIKEENIEDSVKKQMKDSDMIFTQISTSAIDNFAEAKQLIVKLYVPDMTISRAGISHVLKRLEEYYSEN